jgi:hypothetical protein
MRFAPQVLSALLLFAAATGVAQAQTITNGGFEAQTVVGDPNNNGFRGSLGGFTGALDTTTNITGWEVITGNVDLVENFYQQPGTGRNTIDMRGLTAGTIRQLVTGFTSGVTYALSWDMAANTADGSIRSADPVKNIAVSVYEAVESFSKNYSASKIGFSYADMGWTRRSFEFTPTKTGAYYVEFRTLPDTDTNGITQVTDAFNNCCEGAVIDNVALSVVAVPGPAAGAGLPVTAFAAGGMMWLRRRRAVAKAVAA